MIKEIITCSCKTCGGNTTIVYSGELFYNCSYCNTTQDIDSRITKVYNDRLNKEKELLTIQKETSEIKNRASRIEREVELIKERERRTPIVVPVYTQPKPEVTNINLKTNYTQKEAIEKDPSFEDLIKHPIVMMLIAILIIGILICIGVESTSKKNTKREVQSNKVVITTKQETKQETTYETFVSRAEQKVKDYEEKNNLKVYWSEDYNSSYNGGLIQTEIDNLAVYYTFNNGFKVAMKWAGWFGQRTIYINNYVEEETLINGLYILKNCKIEKTYSDVYEVTCDSIERIFTSAEILD